jgi:hypothetical protein
MTSFDWQNLMPIGDELSRTGDEAHLRSAFGRYYYAPYGFAKYYLIGLGRIEYLGPLGSHSNLIDDKTSPDYNEQNLGIILEELFEKRVEADYLVEKKGKDLDLKYFKDELDNVKTQSAEAIKLVRILKNNPPRHRFR